LRYIGLLIYLKAKKYIIFWKHRCLVGSNIDVSPHPHHYIYCRIVDSLSFNQLDELGPFIHIILSEKICISQSFGWVTKNRSSLDFM